jgi:hypothetical protein
MRNGVVDELIAFFVFLYMGRVEEDREGGNMRTRGLKNLWR